MKIQYVMMDSEIRVHRAGCSDVKKDALKGLHGFEYSLYDIEADTQRAVIEDAYSDFIFMNDQQPWTDYEMYSKFLPCCASLPRDAEVSR